jgi:hypothetical protein
MSKVTMAVCVDRKLLKLTVPHEAEGMIEKSLNELMIAGEVKWFNNKGGFFVIHPQEGYQPIELWIEIMRKLKVERGDGVYFLSL